ncbi:MAG: N-acetyl-gamma-glutamyl-phosphate reductase [Chlorobium sp.]|nr:N-acetyl-gamma-glutamyl-phosphate reductase [Chlorobiaceae bacterium]MCF8216803.1 N-acetyl-gamma-glutamyl-phosphate reductase [Chlorobium sp.]MCF8271554.1 N-acetyl-gamma-glutamyl-phosphate reductase [Chlorobium sp.]MCF8287926.1 N-acetyl-gamma-glutamyl-phosphate reductase [Chlorobium sp.]MCF8291604.1 N-acetyl-gamma-glutamyl-phosphate reductase [Chlorobium sp.]
MQDGKPRSVSVIGASGYSGAELVRLLLRHPAVEIDTLYAFSQTGKRFSDLYPSVTCDREFLRYEGEAVSDIYFLALPHGEALTIVPELVRAGKQVIDLSGDFRLKSPDEHERFYRQVKPADAWMPYAMPELSRNDIASAEAVSNPGCYATSIILGLAPLFLGKDHSVKIKSVNCTAVSGLSGAGRTSKTELSFSEMSENMRAYKVGQHQHTPEIMQALGTSASSPSFDFIFTPMIGPFTRGIYSVLSISYEGEFCKDSADELYRNFYTDAPFVRVRGSMTEVRHVAMTNYCDIHIAHGPENGRLVIVSAIDNLLKGAAGQAIQNMNIMLGLEETLGLL